MPTKKQVETHDAVKAAVLGALATSSADIYGLRTAVAMKVPSNLVSIRKVNEWTDRVVKDLEETGAIVRDGERWRVP